MFIVCIENGKKSKSKQSHSHSPQQAPSFEVDQREILPAGTAAHDDSSSSDGDEQYRHHKKDKHRKHRHATNMQDDEEVRSSHEIIHEIKRHIVISFLYFKWHYRFIIIACI